MDSTDCIKVKESGYWLEEHIFSSLKLLGKNWARFSRSLKNVEALRNQNNLSEIEQKEDSTLERVWTEPLHILRMNNSQSMVIVAFSHDWTRSCLLRASAAKRCWSRLKAGRCVFPRSSGGMAIEKNQWNPQKISHASKFLCFLSIERETTYADSWCHTSNEREAMYSDSLCSANIQKTFHFEAWRARRGKQHT